MSLLEDKLKQSAQGDDSLLYHYTSLSSACKILESGSLRLTNLTNTNDPLEFISPENLGFTYWGDSIDYKKVLHELYLAGQKRKNYVRMLCFCKDLFCTPDEWKNEKNQDFADNLLFKGWARSRMWAQYADNHSGVCLVFDKSEFQKSFNALANENTEILLDRAIVYTNYLSESETSLEDINSEKRTVDDYSNFYLEDDKKKFLFQKCQDYRDENEYRFCLINRALNSPYESMFVNYGASLKAVILGQKFSTSLNLATPDNVEQFKIMWTFGRPSLIKIR